MQIWPFLQRRIGTICGVGGRTKGTTMSNLKHPLPADLPGLSYFSADTDKPVRPVPLPAPMTALDQMYLYFGG